MLESEVYSLSSNDRSDIAVALKANSRLLRNLSEEIDQCFIQFTSSTSALIICGNERYELAFAEAMPTDVYEVNGDQHFLFAGQVCGRLQVTNSSSGAGIDLVTSPGTEVVEHRESRKREITVVESAAQPSNVSAPVSSPPKKRRALSTKSATNEPANKATTSISAVAEPASVIQSPSSMVLLPDLPFEVCAADMLNSLFGGLTVQSIYLCSEQPSSSESMSLIDVYVEFHSISGAELALQRDGETLEYKGSPPTGAAQSGSGNAGGGASSSSSAKPKAVRMTMIPEIDTVSEEMALWVRQAAVRVFPLPAAQAPRSAGLNTTFGHHLEGMRQVMREVNAEVEGGGGVELLCSPQRSAEQWHTVLAQMQLPPGCVDAYSENGTHVVRVKKDSAYLFTHPVVDEILLHEAMCRVSATTEKGTTSAVPSAVQPTHGILADEEHEELYNYQKDTQRQKFAPFVQDAAEELRLSTDAWSMCAARSAIADSASGSDEVRWLMVHDCLFRRVLLFRVLYKESWNLSTTYCVMK